MTVFISTAFAMPEGFTFARLASIFTPALIYVPVGFFFFIRSRELASWLLPLPSDERAEELPPHPLGVASVAFAVIGVVFFLHAVPTLIRFGTIYSQIEDPKAMHERFRMDIPQIAGSAIQLVLGFVLFLKSRTFATTWWRKQQPKTHE